MANDLNQCNFIGRLGADVEMRYMANGDAVASFRIAVGWKSKDKEGAEWVSITAFQKLAEICGEYLKKGSQVFVSGRMKTEEYTDKEGVKRYSTKIVADRMQMLGSKQGGNAHQNDDDAPAPRQAAQDAPAYRNSNGGRSYTPSQGASDMDDDIPFANPYRGKIGLSI